MLLTLSCIDRAHTSETRELQLYVCPPPHSTTSLSHHPLPPINGVCACMCVCVLDMKDSAGYVGAIKEHFCSAGRCDDSFMRVPEEKRGNQEVDKVRDEEAEWHRAEERE